MGWVEAGAVVGVGLTVASWVTVASAFSGSELLSTTNDFGNGYLWGVAESATSVAWSNDPKELANQRALWQCLHDANVTSSTFGDAVRAAVRNDPALLTQPAAGAALKTLHVMCPARQAP